MVGLLLKMLHLEAKTLIFWGFLLYSSGGWNAEATEITYRAAVFEFEPYNVSESATEYGKQIVKENARIISEQAAIAKQNQVDIMVTPEYGIQSLLTEYQHFRTFTQYVPDKTKSIIPCDEEINEYSEAVRILSCAARENNLYLVSDLGEMNPCNETTIGIAPSWGYIPTPDCPLSGYFFHNTQVVFDRRGAVIARYRKIHLYLEPEYTPGPNNYEEAIFITDFGVTFTQMICFDILFENPGYTNIRYGGIKDAVMSTAWVDLLPFGAADTTQNAWSREMGANLLVSGYHCPEKTKLGSGIYKGFKKEDPAYTYNKDSGNKLVISDVTTLQTVPLPPGPKKTVLKLNDNYQHVNHEPRNEGRTHNVFYSDLTDYEAIPLPNTNSEQRTVQLHSVDGNIQCDLSYEYNGNLHYKLVAFSGSFPVSVNGELSIGAQICSVIWCSDENDINTCGHVDDRLPEPDSFGPFSMTVTTTAEIAFPVTNERNLLLVDIQKVHFEFQLHTYKLYSEESLPNVLSLTVFGRWLAADTTEE